MNYCLLGETDKCYPTCKAKCTSNSSYYLKDGDVIEWVYTCDLGKDVGDNSMA